MARELVPRITVRCSLPSPEQDVLTFLAPVYQGSVRRLVHQIETRVGELRPLVKLPIQALKLGGAILVWEDDAMDVVRDGDAIEAVLGPAPLPPDPPPQAQQLQASTSERVARLCSAVRGRLGALQTGSGMWCVCVCV